MTTEQTHLGAALQQSRCLHIYIQEVVGRFSISLTSAEAVVIWAAIHAEPRTLKLDVGHVGQSRSCPETCSSALQQIIQEYA